MFKVNTETGMISLHRGDTGAVDFQFTGYRMEPGDIVIFTMKDYGETTVIREEYLEPEDNTVTVVFRNPDTDRLASGEYKYDLRVVHVPLYDENGKITDTLGGFIRTPKDPIRCQIREVVGDI